MNEKKNMIYDSSQQAFWKLFILVLTLGISVLASLFDTKSCYITILVQACNNIYDFSAYIDNLKYNKIIKRESIAVLMFSLIAGVFSVIGLLGIYAFMECMIIKLVGIFFVALPLAVVYYDYKMNIGRENNR